MTGSAGRQGCSGRCPLPGSPSSARSTSTSSRAARRCPAPGRPSAARPSSGSRAARAPTRRSPAPGSAPRCAWSRAVGRDAFADEALAGLREAGVELDLQESDAADGRRPDHGRRGRARRRSSSRPGANALVGGFELPPSRRRPLPAGDPGRGGDRRLGAGDGHVLPQRRARAADPASTPDLAVVNRFELESLARTDGLVALTLGAEGAVLLEDGEEVARAAPPPVDVVDGTAAGDAFTACLLVSLLEGRDREEALDARLRRRRARRLAPRSPAVPADRGTRSTRSSPVVGVAGHLTGAVAPIAILHP